MTVILYLRRLCLQPLFFISAGCVRMCVRDVKWVYDNIGAGTREEDVLFAYPLTGHYRIP